MPMVIRIPFGGGIGAVEHHSESPEAYFAHTAGLKVVACSNPVDAYWMIQQAVASDDPVIFFEPKRRYHEKAEVDESATPLPLHAARVVREGAGRHAARVRADGQDLPGRGRRGRGGGPRSRGDRPAHRCPRSTWPRWPRRRRRPGRVITVHEAPVNLGLGAELAARITEQCFYSLEAPVLRVGGFDMPYPPSRVEDEYLPDLDRVLDAVDRSLAY